jgi:hypothetical protein
VLQCSKYLLRLDLREILCEYVDWMRVSQDMDQWWSCEHDNEPSGSIKDGKFD